MQGEVRSPSPYRRGRSQPVARSGGRRQWRAERTSSPIRDVNSHHIPTAANAPLPNKTGWAACPTASSCTRNQTMNARPDCHAVPDSVAAGQAHAGNIGRNRTEIVRVNPSTIAGNQEPGRYRWARCIPRLKIGVHVACSQLLPGTVWLVHEYQTISNIDSTVHRVGCQSCVGAPSGCHR